MNERIVQQTLCFGPRDNSENKNLAYFHESRGHPAGVVFLMIFFWISSLIQFFSPRPLFINRRKPNIQEHLLVSFILNYFV